MSPESFALIVLPFVIGSIAVWRWIFWRNESEYWKNKAGRYQDDYQREWELKRNYADELEDAQAEISCRADEAREAKAELTKVVGFIWGFPPLARNAQDICNHIAEQNRLIRECNDKFAIFSDAHFALAQQINSLKVENAKLMEYAPAGAVASRMDDMAWALKMAACKFREMEKLCLAEKVRDGEAGVHQEYARMCEKALGKESK